MSFIKAKRSQKRLRMGIDGPSGSGKSFSALRFAFALARRTSPAARVAVICTENGSAQVYQGESPDNIPFEFDINILRDYAPSNYTQAIREAGRLKYDVLVVDSLSHAWSGSGGALEIKDSKGGNNYTAWKDVTPMHNQMIESILNSPCHVIVTMRSKTEYVLEDEMNNAGKLVKVPKKIGMAPVQRAGMEYEFDVYGSMDLDTHTITITKSRCSVMDKAVATKPGAGFIVPLMDWLDSGEPSPPPEVPPTSEEVKTALIGRMQAAKTVADIDAVAADFRGVKGQLGSNQQAEVIQAGTAARERVKAGTPAAPAPTLTPSANGHAETPTTATVSVAPVVTVTPEDPAILETRLTKLIEDAETLDAFAAARAEAQAHKAAMPVAAWMRIVFIGQAKKAALEKKSATQPAS